MATVAAVAGVFSAVAGVVGAVQQRRQAKAVAREQRRQNALSNRQQAIAQQRSVRRSIAQARVLQAEQEQAGINFGVAGSSIVAGTTGAIATDTATAIGASNTNTGAQQGIANAANRIGSLRADMQNNPFTTLANFAGGFTNAANNEALKTSVTDLFS